MRVDRTFVVVAVGLAGIAFPGSAAGSTQLGQVSATDPPNNVECSGANLVQLNSPTLLYTVPSPGVITMWSHRGDDVSAGSGRLQVWAPAGGGAYTLVGRSDPQAFTPGSVGSYPTRIPVTAGDHLGLRSDGAGCYSQLGANPNDSIKIGSGPDPSPGDTVLLTGSGNSLRVNVAAVLEADADGDGFGDETQDCDPANAAKTEDCVAPVAAITKHPKEKSKRKQATFEFSSSEPNSTFECEIDGGPFERCNSPKILKVSKGRHNFQVRATDQSGNVGALVTFEWRVRKKK